MADAGPPLILIATGLVLWLAVDATLGGVSIQTVGIILAVVGAAWLVIEMIQARTLTRRRETAVVREEPRARRRRF